MKPYAIALVAMLAASAASAQTPDETAAKRDFFGNARSYALRVDRAEVNYLHCLASPSDGVVESAMAYLIHMKLAVPERSFADVRDALRELTVDGRTPAIRYKAYLAGAVYDDPHLLSMNECNNCMTQEMLFTSVALRMAETTLSANR